MQGRRVILTRNLQATLRNRERTQFALEIAAETGLEHRPILDDRRVIGIYGVASARQWTLRRAR